MITRTSSDSFHIATFSIVYMGWHLCRCIRHVCYRILCPCRQFVDRYILIRSQRKLGNTIGDLQIVINSVDFLVFHLQTEAEFVIITNTTDIISYLQLNIQIACIFRLPSQSEHTIFIFTDIAYNTVFCCDTWNYGCSAILELVLFICLKYKLLRTRSYCFQSCLIIKNIIITVDSIKMNHLEFGILIGSLRIRPEHQTAIRRRYPDIGIGMFDQIGILVFISSLIGIG